MLEAEPGGAPLVSAAPHRAAGAGRPSAAHRPAGPRARPASGPAPAAVLRFAPRMSRSIALLAVTLAGCTTQLTQAGLQVRSVPPDRTARCLLLGPVEGSRANGASASDNERDATNDVRNRVAKLGGNAFAVTRRDSNPWRSLVQADAYRCPEWEPVPGLAPR